MNNMLAVIYKPKELLKLGNRGQPRKIFDGVNLGRQWANAIGVNQMSMELETWMTELTLGGVDNNSSNGKARKQ